MYKYCLLFLCFACAHTSYSQTPGYQGKRFFAEIGTSFWFNLDNPRANNQGFGRFPDNEPNGYKVTLQEHYFLSLSYVLSRKIALSVAYEYSKTGLHIRESIQILNPSVDYGASTPNRMIYGLVDRHNLFYHLYTHKTSVTSSHYFKAKANLAPLGWHMKWGLDLVLAKSVLIDQKVTYGHDLDFNDNKPSVEYTNPTGINADPLIPMFGFHWGIGYRGIIANRLILHGGFQTTVFPQLFSSTREELNRAGREKRYEDQNHLNYVTRVHQRVQSHYFLNVVVGIGVLIY